MTKIRLGPLLLYTAHIAVEFVQLVVIATEQTFQLTTAGLTGAPIFS